MFVTGWMMVAGLVSGASGQAVTRSMTISAIFDEGGDEMYELAFKHAVQVVNRNRFVQLFRFIKIENLNTISSTVSEITEKTEVCFIFKIMFID